MVLHIHRVTADVASVPVELYTAKQSLLEVEQTQCVAHVSHALRREQQMRILNRIGSVECALQALHIYIYK